MSELFGNDLIGIDRGKREELHEICEQFEREGLDFCGRYGAFSNLEGHISNNIQDILEKEGIERPNDYHDLLNRVYNILKDDNFNLTDAKMEEFRNELKSIGISSRCVNEIEKEVFEEIYTDAKGLFELYEKDKATKELYTPEGYVNPNLNNSVYQSLLGMELGREKDLPEPLEKINDDIRYYYKHPAFVVNHYFSELQELQTDMDVFKEDFIEKNEGVLFNEDGIIADEHFDNWDMVPVGEIISGMTDDAIAFLVKEYVISKHAELMMAPEKDW